ncbi:hypothetical protein [Lactococcus cremoris]|uniref:hypothetical protein n=1 Tax=Lactococcus lactis subsp. cremoris TaxID=1359 RepID=UPI0015CED8AC|nr:hypothetical protein [Lactococcus cremoris]
MRRSAKSFPFSPFFGFSPRPQLGTSVERSFSVAFAFFFLVALAFSASTFALCAVLSYDTTLLYCLSLSCRY